MNAQDFCYWLNGYLELSGGTELNETQVKIVKDHLALVLNKVTPNRSPFDLPNLSPHQPGNFPFPSSPHGVEITC